MTTCSSISQQVGGLVDCDHLHDTTTRYDPVEKQLTFLLICPVCGTETVLETRHYEPRFQPLAA